MPFTPYHFGPLGFIALLFKKWLDIPVFILVNIIIDFEVLIVSKFNLGHPFHRYAHTLLLGAIVGIISALAAYPFRNLFARVMRMIRLPYQPTLKKMIISAILGVWFHVLIDAIYHHDVSIFWPNKTRYLYHLLSKSQVKTACLIFWVLAIVLYLLIWYLSKRKSSKDNLAKK